MKNILPLIFLLMQFKSFSQQKIDFESLKWKTIDAQKEFFLGRNALQGTAILDSIDFKNGIIEVDVAVSGKRSYPGIIFRMQDIQNYERFYLRPHRAGLYPDALQYVPVMNGIAGWQLYIGQGYSNEIEFPVNEWVHLKMEVKDDQARLFVGESPKPSLEIYNLKTLIKKGSIGVMGPKDGSAYFSNFSYTQTNDLVFEQKPYTDTIPGLFNEVLISQAFTTDELNMESYPTKTIMEQIEWQQAKLESNGLVDFSNYTGRTSRKPNVILTKIELSGKPNESKTINFGYSDAISIFHNGKLVFSGNSSYRYRDPSFLGIIGLFDAITVNLEEDKNELIFIVAETFGGWGIMLQDAKKRYVSEQIEENWHTLESLEMPESAVYDNKRNCIYVSNYDGYNFAPQGKQQSIAKISTEGEILDLEWVKGLSNPTGICIFNDMLYAVERKGIAKINIEKAEIVEFIEIEGAVFLNDIAANSNGDIYVSDSNSSTIFKYSNNKVEKWMQSDEINRPNGLSIKNDLLIVGNNGNNSLKSINLKTNEIKLIRKLNEGIIDGIAIDNEGNIYYSHNEGRLYKIDNNGMVTKLIDLTNRGIKLADFDFYPETKTFYMPTFSKNSVITFKLKQE